MTPRDKEVMASIAGSIRRIGAYVDRAGPAWFEDEMALDPIAKRLEQIGELAKRLPQKMLGRMPEVDWKGVKGIREVLVHDYEGVQVDVVVDATATELPGLLRAVETLLASPEADWRSG
jgi:uncharacterized protein with HEPN domain